MPAQGAQPSCNLLSTGADSGFAEAAIFEECAFGSERAHADFLAYALEQQMIALADTKGPTNIAGYRYLPLLVSFACFCMVVLAFLTLSHDS